MIAKNPKSNLTIHESGWHEMLYRYLGSEKLLGRLQVVYESPTLSEYLLELRLMAAGSLCSLATLAGQSSSSLYHFSHVHRRLAIYLKEKAEGTANQVADMLIAESPTDVIVLRDVKHMEATIREFRIRRFEFIDYETCPLPCNYSFEYLAAGLPSHKEPAGRILLLRASMQFYLFELAHYTRTTSYAAVAALSDALVEEWYTKIVPGATTIEEIGSRTQKWLANRCRTTPKLDRPSVRQM